MALHGAKSGCAAARPDQDSHPQPHAAGKQKGPTRGPFHFLAERVGFEPTVRKTVHLISSQAHSTTLAPLRLVRAENIGRRAGDSTHCRGRLLSQQWQARSCLRSLQPRTRPLMRRPRTRLFLAGYKVALYPGRHGCYRRTCPRAPRLSHDRDNRPIVVRLE